MMIMNVIARLEYELAYYDSAVHRFNHYTTPSLIWIMSETSPDIFGREKKYAAYFKSAFPTKTIYIKGFL